MFLKVRRPMQGASKEDNMLLDNNVITSHNHNVLNLILNFLKLLSLNLFCLFCPRYSIVRSLTTQRSDLGFYAAC